MQNGTHPQPDAVVVGGGLAGLAAAAYLARAGRAVTVFERSAELGGRAATQERGGFHFNLGAHALYRKSAGSEVLRDLGVKYSGRSPAAGGLALTRESTHRLVVDPVSMLTSDLLGAGAKLEAARLFVTILRTAARKAAGISLRDWLDQHVRRPEVRALFRALTRVTSYCNDPERMSAQVALLQLQLATKNVLYLDGGWQTLVDGLRAAAEAAGARIETGARVAAVEHDGQVRGVRLDDGRTIAARTVIVAATPAVASALTGDADLRRYADEAVPVRAACLDVALSRLPRPKGTFALGLDRPTYFSVHSATARLAPKGGALIHLLKYEPPEDEPGAPDAEAELEGVLDRLQPGWRDLLVERRFLPNMTVVNALPSPKQGGLDGRPGPSVPSVRGLFVAGDWVGPEGWIGDAALASARSAAKLALAALPEPAREPVAVT